ncbi:MAG: metal-dependent transcriptional regulator [Kiritimatiellae bacterium]|nr:metal-dependent transcriptional regulator [Kiritimatiellia bacterium]
MSHFSSNLSLSQERYLEVIADLVREKLFTRLHEVAALMAVSRPSACEALDRLTREGLVIRRPQFRVRLTPRGSRLVRHLDHRHRILCQFIRDVLGMNARTADRLACRIEHSVDGAFTNRLLALIRLLALQYPQTLREITACLKRRRAF